MNPNFQCYSCSSKFRIELNGLVLNHKKTEWPELYCPNCGTRLLIGLFDSCCYCQNSSGDLDIILENLPTTFVHMHSKCLKKLLQKAYPESYGELDKESAELEKKRVQTRGLR